MTVDTVRSSQRKYPTISVEYIDEDSDTPNETGFPILIKWNDTIYKMLVDKGATHSYISNQFIEKAKNRGKKPLVLVP